MLVSAEYKKAELLEWEVTAIEHNATEICSNEQKRRKWKKLTSTISRNYSERTAGVVGREIKNWIAKQNRDPVT